MIGRDNRLAAIFFGPLTAPPRKAEGNKILWVSREPQNAPSDLELTVHATWADQQDDLDLTYSGR